ncbi:Cytochrome P450 [Nocardia amikacinitolerans]|uniref:cytochrome P450 n=1 Tax=Nocardia amikacinitolerans TaxID=756689 RepID=UPI0020A31609|nr:cytochrome P450 [Nocardia amikacinitolerans]MCP2298890.1 Cytochrome P450 [Nocardia amikacinitolerans]
MADAVDPTFLSPPRWAPTFIRWHRTPITWRESVRLALGVIPRVRDHTVLDYVAALPGQDDVIVARVPFAKFVVVRDPELARRVLVTNQGNYTKSPDYDLLAVAFGRGLVTDMDEAQWQRNRRLVQPIFAKRNVDGFAPVMVEAAVEAAARIRDLAARGDAVDINAEMNRLTLDITARTMFGTDITGPMSEVVLVRLLRAFGRGFMTNASHPIHRFAAWCHRRAGRSGMPANSRLSLRILRAAATVVEPRAIRDLRQAERVVDGLIADHRAGRIARKDNLLALLMDAADPETGYRYSDQEIHDELMTFIGAGMETTATALTWVWQLLAEHPEARERLHEEVRTVLGSRRATAADVPLLPWTQAVIAETMRLLPPVIGLARTAKERDVLGGYEIRPGQTVVIVLHGVHHHARVWERPDEFDPARFLPENLGRAQKRAALPFGAGKRMCVASGFASMEATLVVATVAQRLLLEPVADRRVRRQVSFTGGPDGPLPMRVRTRPEPERADAAV